MRSKVIVGVMGPGESATHEDREVAYELGKAIAKEKWILLTGGRGYGVMESSMQGACDHGGLTIGVLPHENDKDASTYAQIKIVTGMGSSRNNINVLSSHIIVVLGMAAGTASEVALAIKADKKIILLNQDELTVAFFRKIGKYRVQLANSVEEVVNAIRDYVSLNQIR